MSAAARLNRRDALLALLLLLGIVAYLTYLPRTLGRADESHFLYEAKRIRDGEIIYRDFFQFVTPGAPYIMALLFWLFGTTIDTARIGTAVLHGLSAVMMYVTCRALGVRRVLAVVAPVAFIAVCQAAWQFASWHWFSTFFTLLVLFAMVRAPWPSRPATALWPGLAAGMLMSVQQQKGMAVAGAAAAIFVLDHVIGRRDPDPPAWGDLVRRVAWFGGGVAVILLPVLGLSIALAGFHPVYDALVRFPLVNYHKSFQTTWGNVLFITEGYARYTYPRLLQYVPIVIVPTVLRLLAGLVRGEDREHLRPLLVLIVSCGGAALSIWYFPDFIHIAFIAPVFLVAAAEALEWAFGAVAACRPAGGAVRRRFPDAVAAGVAAVAIALLGAHMWRNAVVLQQQFRFPHDTAFGRIDFPVRSEPALIDHARRLLEETHERELFAYPNLSTPYLTVGAKNPTPYQYFYSHVSPKQHTERVLEIINSRTVPLVVLQSLFVSTKDPVFLAVADHYESVSIPGVRETGEFPTLGLYRRKERVPAQPDGAAH